MAYVASDMSDVPTIVVDHAAGHEARRRRLVAPYDALRGIAVVARRAE